MHPETRNAQKLLLISLNRSTGLQYSVVAVRYEGSICGFFRYQAVASCCRIPAIEGPTKTQTISINACLFYPQGMNTWAHIIPPSPLLFHHTEWKRL